ncbi:hypothetical protein ACROYT_G020747 [Oculina patagonica]
MDSFLSLDELYLSFPNQEFNSSRKHGLREEDCDILRGASDDRGNSCHHRAEGKDEKRRLNGPAFLAADYVVANDERESYAGKLPSIRPAFGKQKKGHNRAEFSCIDVDDFSVSGQPVMFNTRREMKETTNCRNYIPSPGHHNCPVGEKWENNAVEKKSSASANSCNAFVYRPRQLSLGSYAELHGRSYQPAIFSSPVCSKPGRPSELPEKFAKFLEMEFSIIKGEKVNSTQRCRLRSDSVPTHQRGPLYPNSMDLRRSQSPSVPELRKPVMNNAKRNIKESSSSSISTRRDSLPSPRLRSFSGGVKWENDSVAESFFVNRKSASDSPTNSKVPPSKLDLKGGTQSLPSEQKVLMTAPPRDVSPRLSPKELGNRALFSPSATRHQVQQLPLDLPEKFTKFIEMDFSIPKGESVSSTQKVQKQKYSVAVDSVSPRETVSLFPNPAELRKSQNPSSLLQRRGKEENSFH